MRFLRMWLMVGVALADCLLVGFRPGLGDAYWLFAVICWTTLNVYWAVASRHLQLAPGGRFLWLVSLGEFLLYALPLGSVPILGFRLVPRTPAIELLGAALSVFGMGVAIWSRHILAGSWNSNIALRDGHALVQRGPYAILRHPIYCGFMMLIVGLILALLEVRALVLLLDLAVFFRRIKPEEKILREKYPETYPAYAQRVRRLIPCIW
jgi:protein-S-isoprenylcysteine O-methyltransferase Ste14